VFKYRWIGPTTAEIPDAGVTVQPDQEFESPVELNHPHCKLVAPPKAKPAAKEA
jgi:hypothetical protein